MPLLLSLNSGPIPIDRIERVERKIALFARHIDSMMRISRDLETKIYAVSYRPALCAAAKGQLETLKILMQHGGSLHVRTVRGTGIGHEAVASGRIELIKWLAKRRPSTLDVATHDGKTPLHVAALHGHLDACKVLLDHGARINAVLRTSRGNAMTPLDAALYRGHRDCAKLIQMQGGITAQRLRLRNTAPNKGWTHLKRI